MKYEEFVGKVESRLKDLILGRRRMEGDPEAYGLEEFYRRVAEKEGIDADEATKHVSAFMKVLGQAISDGDLQDVRSQLPREFYLLLQG